MDKKNFVISLLSVIAMVLCAVIFGMSNAVLDTNSVEMQKIIGTWTPLFISTVYGEFHFNGDGSFVILYCYGPPFSEVRNETQNGTYTMQNGELILMFENSSVTVYHYIFSNNDTYVNLIRNIPIFEDQPNIVSFSLIRLPK
jgi:hypothetical protein